MSVKTRSMLLLAALLGTALLTMDGPFSWFGPGSVSPIKRGNDPKYTVAVYAWSPKELEVSAQYSVGDFHASVNLEPSDRPWHRDIEFNSGVRLSMRVVPRFPATGDTQLSCAILRNGSRVAEMELAPRGAAICKTIMH